ncbi:MAG: site-specific DNA-methyltransferase [Turicibacter sp.]|nr:site-specific DNA-methyltransferase [Turicibacter sp.]
MNNKEFLPNSYTSFKQKIGLGYSDGKLLSENKEVVLNFPFKECVLEGGQDKEDTKRDEIFFNETLAPMEIDRLLDDKVFEYFKRYDKDGVHEISDLEADDNLIIKGNNLIALHSLKKRFAGKVKLIYIDPPYNTGSDSFRYNDKFNHSTWLTFMKNRLEVAKSLLSENGSIFINIDDDEGHYLKVLGDEVFGRENFVNSVIWEKRYSPTNDAKWLSDAHDLILCYAKNKEIWRPNLLPRTDKQNQYYKYDDNDGRGRWRSDNVLVKTFSTSGVFPIVNPNTGVEHYPTEGSAYRFSQETAQRYLSENRFYFGKDGLGAPQLKRFLSEVKQGVTALTIWKREDVSDNQEAITELKKLGFSRGDFTTPKPERLLQRVIHLGSNEGDLVLDFFMGSATTQAVAMKMNRRFIGIEQMDYINTISVPRLQKVMEGEQGGISKDVDWQGGGSFVYCELKNDAQDFKNRIRGAQASGDLLKLFNEVQKSSFLSYRVEINPRLDYSAFSDLTIGEQKMVLEEMVDYNNLYVNYSDMDDTHFNLDEPTKKLNRQFYGEEN